MTERRGQRIPGSRYVRDFCARCKEPIRVRFAGIDPNFCESCDMRGPVVRQAIPAQPTKGAPQ